MDEHHIYEQYQALCSDLNLDTLTKDETWKTYSSVKQMYTLEGNQSHWLCCAVYVACRQATIPSISSPVLHGNYVNLTRLLRTCQLSLVEFFDKSRKWGDMTNLKPEHRTKIERLERNFAVTTVIFKKFDPIFAGIFKDFTRRDTEVRPNRKKLSFQSPADLFDFCWTLFLCVKSSLRISDDLVNSYHLLLACVDFICHNVVRAGMQHMFTQEFAEVSDPIFVDQVQTGDPYCTIYALCDLYDGVAVEAKTIKEFWLKPKIRSMIENATLKGDIDNLTGLIDENYYEYNYRRMEKEYEEYVLTEGDFDERMYLSSERQADFGMDSVNYEEYLKTLETEPAIKTMTPVQELRHLLPQTPLTGKSSSDKDDVIHSPISSATQCVSRLQSLLCGRTTEPTEHLKGILNSCTRNPIESIQARVKNLTAIFCQKYGAKNDNQQPGFHAEFIKFRSQLGHTLYYRLLESVLILENKRESKLDFSDLMSDENFHTSLFALSIEIVLCSYKSQKRFPWILDAFVLDAYHFYKVIELVIRAEEHLCREIVKYLSQVEERVLEELVWKADCPLWSVIAGKNEPIPSCEEVFLPSQIDKFGEGETQPKRYAVIKTPAGEKCVPVAVGGTNQSTLIIQDKTSSQILGVVLPSKHGDKPKKGNSIALFFRKFYHLVFVRLQDLCKRLGVENDLLRKIWTCCQEAIVNNLEDLMKGRHVDQIIMCCVYVVSKVAGTEKTFTDIMKCYRMQPQSASHVYRNVMLSSPDEHGDLIKFYNTIFIGRMQKHALRFSNRSEDNNVPLSPVPNLKATPLSPCRKMSDKHSVFLRTLRSSKTPSPAKQLMYQFNRSPNSTLKAINSMIQIADPKPKAVKRILTDEILSGSTSTPMETIPSPSKFARRLQDALEGQGQDEQSMTKDNPNSTV